MFKRCVCVKHFLSTSVNYSMAPAIPDRWLDYTAVGTRIEGTRFICFKVPLSKNVQRNTNAPIWDVENVEKSIPNLGCVIDLTNTSKYYRPKEFEDKGVKHVKIMVPGREIPPESIVRRFFDAVQMFISQDKEKLIGVHCTHGLNRTGYFVCRYMRDRMTIAADDAIAHFEKARGHTIERQNFLADLKGLADIPPPDSFRKSPTKGAIARQSGRDVRNPYNSPSKSSEKSSRTQEVRNSSKSYSSTAINQRSEKDPEKSNERKESSYSNYSGFNKSSDSSNVSHLNSDERQNDRRSQNSYRTCDGKSRWSSAYNNTNDDNYDRTRFNADRNSGNSYGNSGNSYGNFVDSNRELANSNQNHPVRTRFTSNRSYNDYNSNDRDNYNRGGNRYRNESSNGYNRNTVRYSDNDRRSAEVNDRPSRRSNTHGDVPTEEGSWRRR